MTRNDKIALGCLAIAAGAIVLTCWLTNPTSVGAIDQGWATLIAGLLGFSAIAHQTRVGFRSLRASAIEQSRADRAAREHQAELARQAEISRNQRITAALAAALAAELNSARNLVFLRIKILKSQRELFEKHLAMKPTFKSMNELIPEADTVVFRESAGNMGMLGPRLAYEVVDLYSKLNYKVVWSMDLLVGAQVAETIKTFEGFYGTWIESHGLLQPHLIALSHGTKADERRDDSHGGGISHPTA